MNSMSGVKQGSALSPMLFTAVMVNITRGVKERTKDAEFIFFADGYMLWGDSAEKLQNQLKDEMKWRNK